MSDSIASSDELQRAVRFALPFWAKVAVMTHDSPELPDLEGRYIWQFDVGGEKTDIGAAAAGAVVAQMRSQGCEYLVIPAYSMWWLDRHPDFRWYLDGDFRRVGRDDEVCLLYSLLDDRGPPVEAPDGLPMPPPEMIGLVAGNTKPPEFLSKGKLAVTWISEMLARNGLDMARVGSMLDFGCGCGRVIRHWPSVTPARLYGSDYNSYLIDWCRANLPVGEFAVNELEPPLPFADESFDLLYSLSIFTHLDEPIQVPWMRDLVRVVKPGGLLLLTFHGRSRLEPLAEPFISRFESGQLTVWKPQASGGSACAVWHPERYIREVLAKEVEILEFSPAGALDVCQDAVLFRKPEARLTE